MHTTAFITFIIASFMLFSSTEATSLKVPILNGVPEGERKLNPFHLLRGSKRSFIKKRDTGLTNDFILALSPTPVKRDEYLRDLNAPVEAGLPQEGEENLDPPNQIKN